MGAEIHVSERSHCIQLTFICRKRAQIQQNITTANLGERLHEYSPLYFTIGLKTFQNKTLGIRHDPSNSRRRLSFYPSSSYSKQKLSSFLLVCDSGSFCPELRLLGIRSSSPQPREFPENSSPALVTSSSHYSPAQILTLRFFRGFFD